MNAIGSDHLVLRRRQGVAAAACAFLALATVAPLAAQPVESRPASSVSEQISVELVNVEVRVVDRDGHRVAGLPREAFRILEDGNPVEISHFTWIPEEAPGVGFSDARSPAGGDEPGASGPRQFAIFFDELQIGDHSRGPLLSALYRSLSARLAPSDRVSVVRFDGADLDVLLPWSTDRKKLGRAFEELGGFSANRMTAGLELRSWMRLLEEDIKGGLGRRQSGGCPDAGVILRGYADLVRRNVEYSASALLRYAIRLSHEEGQRILLHVSDGIPFVAGGEAYQYAIDMCSGEALAQGVPGAFSVLFDGDGQEATRDRFDPFKARLEMNEYVMASLWTDVTARINALGVTVYALQGAESGTQFLPEIELGVIPAAARAMAEQNPVDTLALLARETGGLLARGGRGIEEEVERLVADLGGYYSLGFTPAPGSQPGLRQLKVEVDRPGVEIRHRRSYRLESRDERISIQLAELFDADRVENPLALTLSLRRADGTAEPRRLQVVVPFGQLSLIPSAAGGEEGHFTVFVAVRRAGGRLLAPRQRAIVARRADPNALAFTYEIALPDDEGDVAVAVVDDYSGAVAFARERLRGD